MSKENVANVAKVRAADEAFTAANTKKYDGSFKVLTVFDNTAESAKDDMVLKTKVFAALESGNVDNIPESTRCNIQLTSLDGIVTVRANARKLVQKCFVYGITRDKIAHASIRVGYCKYPAGSSFVNGKGEVTVRQSDSVIGATDYDIIPSQKIDMVGAAVSQMSSIEDIAKLLNMVK